MCGFQNKPLMYSLSGMDIPDEIVAFVIRSLISFKDQFQIENDQWKIESQKTIPHFVEYNRLFFHGHLVEE